MARDDYTVIARPIDDAGSAEMAVSGNVVAVSAPAEAGAEFSLDGGPWIPSRAFPEIRSTCGEFSRIRVRWGAVPAGMLYVFAGDDFDVGMIAP